jgi:hypothetical protein
VNRFADAETPVEVLQFLAGGASLCWSNPRGAGEFQPQWASDLVDEALERLIELGFA